MMTAIHFNPIYLPVNQGHGNARRLSLSSCRNNLVALMDADDISLSNRFEKQLDSFVNDPTLHIVGGQISEFIGSPDNIIGRRTVPDNDADIKQYMKKRCPMNQVSVMMKKDFADHAGGYIDWFCEEDYYLWLRMAKANGKFSNVSDTLVNVRIGDEMSSRRGGWKYFSSEARLQKYMLDEHFIGLPRYLYNIAIRFAGEVLISNKLRTKLFKLMRSDIIEKENIETNTKIQQSNTPSSSYNYPPFSVAMCVYGGDNAEWFDTALKSVIDQTIRPDEIVLVVDGPIPESIQNIIDKYSSICRGGGGNSNCYISQRKSGTWNCTQKKP